MRILFTNLAGDNLASEGKVAAWETMVRAQDIWIYGAVIFPGLLAILSTNPSIVRFEKEAMPVAIHAGRLCVDQFNIGQLYRNPCSKRVLNLSHSIGVFHQ